MTDSRSPIGRFGPLKAGHPSVGEPCVVCKKALCEGDVPSLISLAPADAEEAAKQAAGRPFNAVAGIAHEGCAWPSESRRSTTCVVVKSWARDIDDPDSRCGKPVVGERGEFPMCREHMDLFDPKHNEDETWT